MDTLRRSLQNSAALSSSRQRAKIDRSNSKCSNFPCKDCELDAGQNLASRGIIKGKNQRGKEKEKQSRYSYAKKDALVGTKKGKNRSSPSKDLAPRFLPCMGNGTGPRMRAQRIAQHLV